MNGYYKLIIGILKKNGFNYLRNGDGSHELWGKGSFTMTVPFNCYSRHTANAIMKACKINHHF